MPDYTENKYVSNPNSNIGGPNLDSMFGSSKSKQPTSNSTSGFKDTSVSEYLRLRALNAPEGAAKEFAMKEYSEFLKTNGQGTPAVANPLAPVTSAATSTPTPTTPATPAAPTPTPTPTPPATPAAPAAPAAAPKAAPSPCDSIMEDINYATKLSRDLESENPSGTGRSLTVEQEMRRRTIHSMLVDAQKRMMECNRLREKERRAPEIKAAKDKMVLDVKNAAANKAFHANAKEFGRKQADNVMEKTAALLSIGAITPEQYQVMNEDPSTYSDTIDRLWSQNFNQDVGSPEVGHNESQPAPAPAAPVAAVEPPKAPYGQQNSGRYDRFKPAFTPPAQPQQSPQPPQPQQPNKPPYGYPNYSAYG